jgi:hypothetical protein
LDLFSIQPLWVFEQLAAGQPFHSKPEFAANPRDEFDEGMLAAYAWLGQEMDQRCTLRRPPEARFPVWAWHTWYGTRRRKPDLRFSDVRAHAAAEPQVLLTLEIPDEVVLLSDFDAWHHVLNRWYLDTESETDNFEGRCKAAGLNAYSGATLADAALEQERAKTWQAVFELGKVRDILKAKPEQVSTQATFWEIRPEYVLEAVRFGNGQRSQKLVLPKQRGLNNPQALREDVNERRIAES